MVGALVCQNFLLVWLGYLQWHNFLFTIQTKSLKINEIPSAYWKGITLDFLVFKLNSSARFAGGMLSFLVHTGKWVKTFPSAFVDIFANFIKFDAISGHLL